MNLSFFSRYTVTHHKRNTITDRKSRFKKLHCSGLSVLTIGAVWSITGEYYTDRGPYIENMTSAALRQFI